MQLVWIAPTKMDFDTLLGMTAELLTESDMGWLPHSAYTLLDTVAETTQRNGIPIQSHYPIRYGSKTCRSIPRLPTLTLSLPN
jgi:hypothetical protein